MSAILKAIISAVGIWLLVAVAAVASSVAAIVINAAVGDWMPQWNEFDRFSAIVVGIMGCWFLAALFIETRGGKRWRR